jgi:hypothetical protein
MVAIIGGTFERFRPLVDLYREAGARAGHAPEKLKVGVHAMGFRRRDGCASQGRLLPRLGALTATIGRDAGWPAPTRHQFDVMASPKAPS